MGSYFRCFGGVDKFSMDRRKSITVKTDNCSLTIKHATNTLLGIVHTEQRIIGILFVQVIDIYMFELIYKNYFCPKVFTSRGLAFPQIVLPYERVKCLSMKLAFFKRQ